MSNQESERFIFYVSQSDNLPMIDSCEGYGAEFARQVQEARAPSAKGNVVFLVEGRDAKKVVGKFLKNNWPSL